MSKLDDLYDTVMEYFLSAVMVFLCLFVVGLISLLVFTLIETNNVFPMGTKVMIKDTPIAGQVIGIEPFGRVHVLYTDDFNRVETVSIPADRLTKIK